MKISNTKALLNRLLVSLALVTACFVGLSSSAEAATCFTCHAPVGSTIDIRPVESTYRNYSTGSIKGSHLKHIPAITTAASSCVPCHTGASGYSANHSILSGNMIQLPNVGYLKGASFSQSGNPALSTCATASCHSSAYGVAYVTSPTWGNASNCLGCHTGVGAFTGTGSSPNTGSHTKHLAKGSVCGSCHTGASATSGGNAHIDGNIDVVAGGYSVANVTKHTQSTYTGTCATASCHVSAYGTDLRPSTVWGIADCAACHSGLGAFTGTGSAPNTGSHNLHGATAATCSTCHAGAVKGLSGGNAHINQKIEVTGMGYSFTNITKHTQGTGYGKCSTSVCHADPYSTNSAISPTWGVPTGCASCHNGVGAFTGSGSSPNTGSHTKHMLVVLPVQGATTCGSCHLGATASTGGAGHANTIVDLLGYATATVSKHAPASGYKTCTTAACHVSVYSAASLTSPTWGVSSACGECHVGIGAFTGGGSAPITGSHTKHMALNLPGTGQVNCASCHAGAVYGTSGGNNHIDGTIDVTGYITPNVVKHAPNTTFQTCTTAACHVNPYGAASIPSPTWGVVILCGECHTGIGALTGTGSAPITGSHTKHMAINLPGTGQVTCATCHVGTVSGTTGGTAHIDGDIDVIGYRAPNVVKHAANTTFTTCTTAACHVNPYGPASIASPTWGLVITCGECHVGVGAFSGTNTSPTTGSHTKHQAAGYACNSCHTGVTAGVTGGPAHIDGNIDVIAGMYYANNITKHAAGSGYGVCNNASCHADPFDTTPVVTPSWGVGGPGCANCHTTVGAFTGTGSSPTTGSHKTHQDAGNACNSCHAGVVAGLTGGPMTAHRDGNIDVGGGSGYPLNISKHLAVTGYSTCSTSSCHLSSYANTSVVTPSWGTETASHCAGCHVGVGSFTGAGTGPTTGSHSKHLKANPLCANCHTGAIAGVTGGPAGIHKDTNIDVIGGYTLNVPKHTPAPSTSTDRCNTAICHANVYGTQLLQTPTWGNAVGCVACHTGVGAFTGIGSAPNTGSHTRHIAANPLCSNCHAGASSGNTGSGGSAHTDGNIDITVGMGYPTNLTKHTVALGFRCSTASCHSSPYGVASITTPTWGTLGSCGSCHTGVGAFTSSSYPTTGSHTKHIAAANAALPPNQGCSACHAGAVAATSGGNAHTDGNVDVTGGYSNTANVTKHTAGTGYGSCSTAICHTSPYGTSVAAGSSPVWGQAGSCVSCHNGVGSFTGTGSTPATGRHTQHMSVDLGKPATCQSCHDGAVSGVNGGFAHIDGNIDVTFVGYTPNVTRHPAGTYTGSCLVTCHGSALASNTIAGYPAGTAMTYISKPLWNAPFLDGLPSIAGNGTSSWGTGDCAKCHGFPPMTSTHAGKTAIQCMGCHPTVSAAGTSFTSPATHVDGTVNSNSTCIGCHNKVETARANVVAQFTSSSHHYQGGTTITNAVCFACHWEAADTLGGQSAYHTKTGTSPVDLVVWSTLGTRPASWSTTGTVTAVTFVSGGAANSPRTEIAKINTHCLGCHNDANKNITPFANDTNTPSTYSWEALSTVNGGFGAAQSIGAKYSNTTTTAWGKFSGNFTNNKNQVKAFSAHNNTLNQRGWSTLAETLQGTIAVANYPNTSGTVAVLCFDCHNSHGSAANTPTAITSSYNSATGTKRGAILKQTIAGQGGYTMTYTPGGAGSVAEKNQHNAGAGICFDCHNNSAASTATLSGSTTPWGYTATFGASQVIHGYNDTPYFGKTGGTFAKTQTYTYTAGTAGAMNVNRGGHFGASSTLINAAGMQIGGLCTPCHDPHGVSPGISTPANSVPLLKGTYVTSPYKVDVAGPIVARGGGSNQPVIAGGAATAGFVPGYHIDQNTMQAGRTMKPANAGSWLFATSAKSLQTMNSTQFGGLCQKCHTQATLNSTAAASSANWKSSGRIHNSVAGWASAAGGNVNNTKHAFTCSKCHATHNSRLPRLLVTNCLDVKHAGRVISQGTVPRSTSLYISPRSATTSGGRGRFPGGGGGLGGVNTATNPGPWYFGNTSVGTAVPTAATTCHQSATAGGTTFNPASQYWNTKSLW